MLIVRLAVLLGLRVWLVNLGLLVLFVVFGVVLGLCYLNSVGCCLNVMWVYCYLYSVCLFRMVCCVCCF